MKRRNFIQNAAAAIALPSLFGRYNVEAVGLSPWLSALTNTVADTDHVLVIIRLNGGNDALQMVIPLDQYTNLSAARSNILINEAQVLKLNGVTATGLHPAMTGMQSLFNEGKLKIVQGVGYPNQNFSHFRSTDIYMSASDATQNITTGWMGRYLANEYANYPAGYPNVQMPDPLAIQLNEMTMTFQGMAQTMGVTVSDPNNPYNFLDDNGNTLTGRMGKELTFLRDVARQADKYGEIIKAAYTKAGNVNLATYPTPNAANGNNVGLANQLKIVARLIKGGLKTRVYMVQMGGFDTHSNQTDATDHAVGGYARLMTQLSEGITAFQRDCEAMRIQDRVLGMTFSEFGRRIKSNASLGTDHGASYASFVFGTRLHGGMLGVNPTISATTGTGDTVPMQHDFRSIYASILSDWFCVNATDLNSIMLQNFQKLRIVNSPTCITDTHDLNVAAGKKLISNYPNPFTFATTIDFETFGGHTMVQIFDVEGQLLATPVDGQYSEGKYKVYFNGDYLPVGTYYARLQNESISQVRTMVKVR
jgi:uncharacterized protein (DUF1501 family)